MNDQFKTFCSQALIFSVLLIGTSTTCAQITVVDRPETSTKNSYYIGNRAPLQPSALIGLPVGSVQPGGWLHEMLSRQRSGLTGHLGEISAWLQKADNAWLSKTGKGEYGWEELPYWLKGYIDLAYLFEDPEMIAESRVWIEGALASQRADGDFGPDQRLENGDRDYWANMVMLYCLQSFYDRTNDERVLELMTKYFEYQSSVPDDQMLTGYWQRMRGGDNLYAIHWLYNRTGNRKLLDVAEKIHRVTADWTIDGNLPNWHNVNIAECFREPAQYYLQSGDKKHLDAAYANFQEVRKRFGQVPGGMFGGDENCRVGYDDPRQATETCGFVEQMLSDAMMLQITGDPGWADHCENVAFNSYPAAVMPDFRSLRYLTAPNMVVSDSKNHAPGIENNGPFLMMNPFSSRCCQHNHSHGWPYFAKHLWMATPDNGVCATLYCESEVRVKVGDGTMVRIAEKTAYPFDDTIRLEFNADQPVRFPLYLRLPAWCSDPEVSVNGKIETSQLDDGKYIRIEREWSNGDTVTLQLPMQVAVEKWSQNHASVSVSRGPLTYSLLIGEKIVQKDSLETAIGDSKWQPGADPSQWPSFEIHPTTPWNFGLVLDEENLEQSFTVEQRSWPESDFPFTQQEVPIRITAQAKKIPEWTLDQYGLCAELQDSPVRSEQPVETITLVPMGSARLRISAFPVVGDGQNANQWIPAVIARPSKFTITASHCHEGDSLSAMDDGLEPRHSNDHSIPRFTWWDHRGSEEWVQYEFDAAQRISQVSVYWFDDTGVGQCRLPRDWRVLYRKGDKWLPVTQISSDPIAADQWVAMEFSPVDSSAIRLSVNLQPEYSGGILEWRVR